MEQGVFINRTKKFFEAFEAICKPYCQEIGISVQAFEILLAVARGKGNTTAQGICKQQDIKPTLASFHIEKLVQAGYLERQAIDGDRRSIRLVCTEKAMPVLQKGDELYKRYTELIWDGISLEEIVKLKEIMSKIYKNAEKIING